MAVFSINISVTPSIHMHWHTISAMLEKLLNFSPKSSAISSMLFSVRFTMFEDLKTSYYIFVNTAWWMIAHFEHSNAEKGAMKKKKNTGPLSKKIHLSFIYLTFSPPIILFLI